MTFVCTFTPDEPVEVFPKAAARLPDVQFYVTGNYRRANPRVLAAKPENVTLTGFLADGEYVGLLLASDAVICLTTRDHTMQRGAYEAMYLGKPIITSNFDLLRRHFYKGCVHVDVTADALVAGVSPMCRELERFRVEIGERRNERLEEWRRVESDLRRIIGGSAWSFSS
jgi:glycosyltransferase involved in cell wall biosynthesis